MDIDVEVGRDKLSFSGFGLTANLLGHVHIGDNLDTRGELSLADGRYRAYGQRLTIRRARLLFAGPIDQPYLDIEAIRKVDDVIAGIRLSGSAEQPTTKVFSEPAMSQEQALSYLVLGRPLGNTGEDNNMLAEAALGLGACREQPALPAAWRRAWGSTTFNWIPKVLATAPAWSPAVTSPRSSAFVTGWACSNRPTRSRCVTS